MAGELVRTFGNVEIRARAADKYVDATSLCKLARRQWHNYAKREETKEFLKALEIRLKAETSNDVSALVQSSKGGSVGGGQTWIHPEAAIHFIMWASPKFAAQVTKWVMELITTGKVELDSSRDSNASIVAAVKAEVTAELAPLISELRAIMTKPVPDAFTTIPDRCKYWGWSPVPEKLRREIRDAAFVLCWQATGERPVVCLQHSIWTGEQIILLDRAIATVRQKYERLERESGPTLF